MLKGIFSKLRVEPSPPSALPYRAGSPDQTDGNDTPAFQFGLAGFSAAECTQIAETVRLLPQTTLKWHAGDFKTADAVFVCGNHTRNCAAPSWPNEDDIQVLVGSASETPIFLRLPHVDRPLAFSLPVTDPGIEPAFGFDAASPAGVRIVLENLKIACVQSWRNLPLESN